MCAIFCNYRVTVAAIGGLRLRFGALSPGNMRCSLRLIACILCALFYELSLRIWPVEPHVSEDRRALAHWNFDRIVVCSVFAAMAFIPASVVSLTEIAVGPLFAWVFVSGVVRR